MDRRLGRAGFFGAWAGLFAAQLGLLSAMANTAMPEQGGLSPLLVGGMIGLIQLLKLPITAFRLNDIGRPSTDALFFCLIPVANIIGLMSLLTEGTPAEKELDRRRQSWTEQLGPIGALVQALPLMGRTTAVGAPLVVLFSVIMAVGTRLALGLLNWATLADSSLVKMLGDGFSLVAVVLFLYTAMQYSKRSTATRLSWVPSILLLPSVLMAVGFRFFDTAIESQLQLVLLLVFSMAWMAFWGAFGGAGLMVGVTVSTEQVRKGDSLDVGAAFQAVFHRTLDVAGPHGTRIQAIMVGNQVVIPGIFYMLQLAFADTIAVLKPDAAALKESGQLTWGMRGRLFKMFLIVILLSNVFALGGIVLVDGLEPAMAYMVDAREVSLVGGMVAELAWGVSAWWIQVALLLMYHDRVAFLRRRVELRKGEKKKEKTVSQEESELTV